MSNRRTVFCNARLIDPASGLDAKGGLLVENGKIADIGPRLFSDAERGDPETIDCKGLVLAPGLIDMRVFTGEPGSEHRETLESASRAAAAGGVTTIVVMPNTDPVIDEPSLVDFILRRAAATASVRVAPMAALTRHLAGEVMTEIGLLKEAGAVAFSDGDRTIANTRVLRRALAYASTFGALVVGHAEDPDLADGASVTEGEYAMRLGLPAAPAAAEAMIVERDIRLVELTGARYHFGQISCRASLDAIAAAKRRGLPITCGVAAHHLALNELDVGPLLHLHEGEAAAALGSRPRGDGGRRRFGRHRRDRLQPRSASRRHQAPAFRASRIRRSGTRNPTAGGAGPHA